jgi:hypothetical protein
MARLPLAAGPSPCLWGLRLCWGSALRGELPTLHISPCAGFFALWPSFLRRRCGKRLSSASAWQRRSAAQLTLGRRLTASPAAQHRAESVSGRLSRAVSRLARSRVSRCLAPGVVLRLALSCASRLAPRASRPSRPRASRLAPLAPPRLAPPAPRAPRASLTSSPPSRAVNGGRNLDQHTLCSGKPTDLRPVVHVKPLLTFRRGQYSGVARGSFFTRRRHGPRVISGLGASGAPAPAPGPALILICLAEGPSPRAFPKGPAQGPSPISARA